jgi:predicted transcriptional regulator with HTH domain
LPLEDESDLERIKVLIAAALRSRVRRLVLIVVKRSGTRLPISDIAREAGLSPSEAVGAIRGSEGQYSPVLSLLRLHLVRETVSEIPGKRKQKTYEFDVKNQILLNEIERILAKYRKGGEG